MITTRNVEVLKFILDKKGSTISELSKQLKVSQRTVRYDLENINYFLGVNNLSKIEKMSKGEVRCDLSKDQLDEVLISQNLYDISPEERQDYILLKLLFERQEIILNRLTDDLEIAITTLNKDYKKVKETYENSNVKFKSRYRKGIYIESDEESLRNLQLKITLKYLGNYISYKKSKKYDVREERIIKLIDSYVGLDSLEFLELFIKESQNKMKRNISDEAYRTILCYLILLSNNLKKGKMITSFRNERFTTSTEEFKAIESGKNLLEKAFKTEVNNFEMLKITDYFLGAYSYTSDVSYFENWIEIDLLVKKLIDSVNNQIREKIVYDEELFRGLVNHMKPMIYRIKRNLPLKNSIYDDVKESYGSLFKRVEKSCEIIEKVLNSPIPKDEIAFISLHFKAAIDRNELKGEDGLIRKVMVVCGHGYGSSNLIIQEIKKNFYVDVVDVIPFHLLEGMELKNLDFIISTVNIDIPLSVKVLNINPILQQRDFKMLERNSFVRKKQKIYLSQILGVAKRNSTLLDEKSFILDVKQEFGNEIIDDREKFRALKEMMPIEHISLGKKPGHWEEMVDMSVDLLIKTGSVKEGYSREIKDVVETIGEKHFMIGDGIALLHASPKTNVKKTSFSLLTLEDAVEFPLKNKIKIFFCLATRNKTEHINGLMEVLEIMKDKELREQIEKKTDTRELMKIMKIN